MNGRAMAAVLVALAAGAAQGAVFNITTASNIQATVNMATDGDTIVFAAGTYNQVANLGSKQLTLEGAGIGVTVVSGAFLNEPVFRGSGIGSNMGGLVIRDMTIRDGQTPSNATGTGYPVDGGGVVVASSTVLLERVRFEDNHAFDDGGGFYSGSSAVTMRFCQFVGNTAGGSGGATLLDFGTATLEDCEFEMNQALDTNANGDAGWGGAMYVISHTAPMSMARTTFTDNTGTRGAAVYWANSNGTWSACTFDGNEATEGYGGVCYAQTGGTVTVEDCVMRRNTANIQGGVLYSNGPNWVFRRTVFAGNSSVDWGGALYQVNAGTMNIDRCGFYGNSAGANAGALGTNRQTDILNSVFVANDAVQGGALSMVTGPSSVTHCTFYGNTADSQPVARGNSAGGTTTVRNCIAMLNSPVNDAVGGTGWSVVYSDIERSDPMAVVAGAGNINEMPQFVAPPSAGADLMWGTMDDDYGDLRLAPGSAGIDAGDSQSVLSVLVDFNGDNRNLDDPATANTGVSAWALCVDMGAFEFQPEIPTGTCSGDANGDGFVDFDDIVGVLGNWLTECPE